MKTNDLDRFVEMSMEAYSGDDSFYDEAGINKEAYLEEMLQKIRRLNMKTLAALQQSKNEKMMEEAARRLEHIIRHGSDKEKQLLQGQLPSRMAGVLYRNVNEISADDLREIVNEMDLLDMMDKLDQIKEDDE
jgi:hypothetical protein